MPRLPRFQARNRISTDVRADPTLDPRSARRPHDASTEVFDQLTGLGSKLLEMRTRAQATEDEANLEIILNDSEIEIDKKLKAEYEEKGDYKGYAEERNKRLDKASKDFLNTVSNPFTKERLSSKANLMLSRKNIKAESTEGTEAVKTIRRSAVKNLDKFETDAFDRADFANAGNTLLSLRKTWNDHKGNGVYSRDEVEDYEKYARKGAVGAMEGMFDQKKWEGIKRILTSPDLNYAEKELRKKLSPVQLRTYGRQLETSVKSANDLYTQTVTDEVRDKVGQIGFESYSSKNPDNERMANQIRERISAIPNLKTRQEQSNKLESALFKADIENWIATDALGTSLTEENVNNFIDTYVERQAQGSPIHTAMTREKMRNDIYQTKKKINAEIDKGNAVNYFTEKNREMNALSLDMLENPESFKQFQDTWKQTKRNWGITDRAGIDLPDSFKTHFGEGIKEAVDAQDFDQAVAYLEKYETITGKDSYKYIKEVGINPEYAVISHVPKQNRKTVLKALSYPDLNTKYSGRFKDVDDSSDAKDARVKMNTNPAFLAEMSRHNGKMESSRKVAQAKLSAIKTLQKYNRLESVNMSLEGSVDKAISTFSEEEAVQAGRHLALFKKGSVKPEDMKTFMTNSLDTGNSFSPTKAFGLNTGGVSDENYDYNIKTTGEWKPGAKAGYQELWVTSVSPETSMFEKKVIFEIDINNIPAWMDGSPQRADYSEEYVKNKEGKMVLQHGYAGGPQLMQGGEEEGEREFYKTRHTIPQERSWYSKLINSVPDKNFMMNERSDVKENKAKSVRNLGDVGK